MVECLGAATALDDRLALQVRNARRRAARLHRAPGRCRPPAPALDVPLIVEILVALGVASAFAGAVQAWRRNLAKGRREDLRALAARRGWSLTATGGRLGREGALRLAPRGGHAWTVEVRREAGGGLVTEYVADSPRWPGGTLVAAPGPDPIDAGSPVLGPAAAEGAAALAPRPHLDGMTLLADADPAPRVILQDLARALAGWSAPGRPILILSPGGLRLRLGAPIERADRMERFVDLAFDLSRVIGP